MNKVLERQIKKIFGGIENLPQELYPFLKTVSDHYDHVEEDRLLIERSLELSSKELNELNKKLKEESIIMKTNLVELDRINKFMVNRELKMIELKNENAELRKCLGESAPLIESKG